MIEWYRCPEQVREIEQALYELSRLYRIQAKRAQGYKNFRRKVCEEQRFPCMYTDDIVKASEKGKKLLEEMMEPHVKKHPVYRKYLGHLPGLGIVLCGLVLGNIHPWRFATVSKLWAWAGWAPPEYYIKKCGNAECYHRFAKYIVSQVARQLVRNVPFYRSLFQEWFERELRKLLRARDLYDEELATALLSRNFENAVEILGGMRRVSKTEARQILEGIATHAAMRAYRCVAKVWLSQYYEAYCTILGIPYRPPYVVFAGVRNMYYPPIIVWRGRVVPLNEVLKRLDGNRDRDRLRAED